MTALGKTLTVFVFLLSLVWCWLTVNAYATRTNWVTQAKQAQTHMQAAVERAREMEQEYRNVIASSEAQAKKLADTITERDATIAKLQTDNAAIKAQFDRKLAAEKADENKTALLEKNAQSILQQLDALKINKDNIETKLIEATRSEQAARNESLQHKLEAESLRARNETIELQLAQIQEQMRDLRLGRGGSAPGGGPVVPVPSGIRATVKSISADGFITISLGADAGLVKGAVLDVARLSTSKYLGKIRLSLVDPKEAVGVFESAFGVRATGDNLPKVGDLVTVLNN
jgi:hypothetical protein